MSDETILQQPKKPYCQLITLYQVEKLAGSVENKWTTSAVDGPTNSAGHDYLGVFTDTDAEGYPWIGTAPDVTQVNPVAATTNIAQANGIIDDQATSDFWLCLLEGRRLVEFNPTAEAVGVWASDGRGNVQMKQVLNAPYTNVSENPIGYYGRGLWRFRLYHHDITANGIARLWYLNDQGVRTSIPSSWISQTKPKVTPLLAWCCDDGTLWNKDKSERLKLSDTLLLEDIRCSSGSSDCLTCG